MNIDISSAGLATVTVAFAGHVFYHFIRQGEINQWRKGVDQKINEMTAAQERDKKEIMESLAEQKKDSDKHYETLWGAINTMKNDTGQQLSSINIKLTRATTILEMQNKLEPQEPTQ